MSDNKSNMCTDLKNDKMDQGFFEIFQNIEDV